MFSATWPEAIQKLASQYLKRPVKVSIGTEDLSANKRVTQQVEVMEIQDKDRRLLDLLRRFPPSRTNKVIVFALYKKEAERLESLLVRSRHSVVAIHGDKSQDGRTSALDKFRSGEQPLLIATDVAARGLDIPNVEVVINYSLYGAFFKPQDPSSAAAAAPKKIVFGDDDDEDDE